MPVHDWTRVRAGTFHHLHSTWVEHLGDVLNDGLLPRGYAAVVTQPTEDAAPEVLTLQAVEPADSTEGMGLEGALAVAEHPPQIRVTMTAELAYTVAHRRALAIRQVAENRTVAWIEILAPGNKHGHANLEAFVSKALGHLQHGHHLLVVDLLPPSRWDPAGIHGAIWDDIDDAPYATPAGKPLTLASYEAGSVPKAYIEPLAVGDPLPAMPLFLKRGWYIPVPLEATYMTAYHAVPAHLRVETNGRR